MEKILTKFVGLWAKAYINSYLIENISEDTKAKGTKMFDIKRKLKLKKTKTV